jgi:hypothetical protein
MDISLQRWGLFIVCLNKYAWFKTFSFISLLARGRIQWNGVEVRLPPSPASRSYSSFVSLFLR